LGKLNGKQGNTSQDGCACAAPATVNAKVLTIKP